MSLENTEAMLAAMTNASIVDRITVPARKERRKLPPPCFCEGLTGDWLKAMLGGVKNMWSHQALALEQLVMGKNVLVATGTASGKTLTFQTAAIHEILTGRGSTLIIYPQKALSSDQCVRWKDALDKAGLSPDLVGEINGDVHVEDRERVLATSRIVLGTPDIVHSWMMRSVTLPSVQAFLSSLRFFVIDEAHAFDGIFGSNSAFFFRRLRSATARIKAGIANPVEPLQLIAATATIANPAGHLEQLTGCRFEVIGEDANGAPYHGLTLLHIEGPSHGAPAEKMLAEIVASLASEIAPNALLAFADTRQGVERITRAIASDDVLPYRSGYESKDRKRIEDSLREGTLRGTVSTSALELGIDIPQFTIGLNLGIPQSRKAARQRIGRIGRSAPGLFAMIAERTAFTRLGSSFREFYEGAVEPSHLYLENRIIQFQQAACLMEECGSENGVALLPDNVEWPAGFAESFNMAQPAAIRPRDVEQIAALGQGRPHIDYPLRRIGQIEYALQFNRDRNVVIGKIGIEQAMREAYPGAIYYHLKQAYRVSEWRTTSYEHSIMLEPVKGGERTVPMIRTWVNVSHEPADLLDQRLLAGCQGSIAEVCLRVAESVEGYCIGTTALHYRDLSKNDRRKTRKQREFGTTGVVLRIDEPWFKGPGDNQVKARQSVAEALAKILARERSIASADVRCVHNNIAIHAVGGPSKIDDAIVVFDNVQGGLRLTAPLFDEFRHFIEKLRRAVDLAGAEALLSEVTVERLDAWYESLSPSAPVAACHAPKGDELIIFAPDSEVGVRYRGALNHRRLLDHQMVAIGDGEQLMYRYESAPGVHAWVAHDHIEPIGHNWRQVFWNPRTNDVREFDA
jgi:DEAD/DEAH box helicase domain-containing protein